MMSHSNDITLHNLRHTTFSEVRFSDDAESSNVAQNTTTDSTSGSVTTNVINTSPTGDLYTDPFIFVLSKIFAHALMDSFISRDVILKKFVIASIRTMKTDAGRSLHIYKATSRT